MFERARFEREREILLGPMDVEPSAFETIAPANRAAQQQVKFWSLLPHTIDVGAGPVPLAPSRLALSFHSHDGRLLYNAGFQTKLDLVVLGDRAFVPLAIAVADLTADPLRPQVGIHNASTLVFGMSIPKIAAMLAAFQVRKDLRVLADLPAITTAAALFKEARRRWIATQTPAAGAKEEAFAGLMRRDRLLTRASRPIPIVPQEVVQKREATVTAGRVVTTRWTEASRVNRVDRWKIPDLEKMFRVDASAHPVKVDFTPSFAANLGKMIGGSDNGAAHACIAQVGYLTIASVLLQSGLADARRGGGVWIRSNYFVCLETKALTLPGGRPTRECVRRRVATHSYAPFGGGAWNGATAGSLIAFFTLLANDRLVDAASSAEMRALLDKSTAPGNETRSPLTETLPGGGKVFSKLGLVGHFSDAILFERDMVGHGGAPVKLRYAAAALSAPLDVVTRLGEKLNELVRTQNKVP
jgi:hypothetical protein